MAIIDYKLKSEQSKTNLLNDKNISEKNKEYIKSFLDSYDVSYARSNIFCKHIVFLLRESQDIKSEMNSREKINRIFKNIRENGSQGYYETIKAVSLRFIRWLNEGEKPKGFIDIKNSKKGQKRQLKPSDMLTWEDAEKMLEFTNSVQLKAVIMTQLDGGFRPSEFIDINYGDVVKKDNVYVVYVQKGKTGSREVILFKCVPYLEKWLKFHPTKIDGDPLWCMEDSAKSNKKKPGLKYSYPALVKQVRKIGKLANIQKPLDFYNLRHSSCTISKKENVNVELASKKYGHSVKYYVETYGRLTTEEDIERFKKHYKSISKKTENDFIPKQCHICKTINPVNSDFCIKCKNPLTYEKAMESVNELEDVKKQNYNLVKELQKEKTARITQYNKINKVIEVLAKNIDNPEVKKLLLEY